MLRPLLALAILLTLLQVLFSWGCSTPQSNRYYGPVGIYNQCVDSYRIPAGMRVDHIPADKLAWKQRCLDIAQGVTPSNSDINARRGAALMLQNQYQQQLRQYNNRTF